MNSPKFGLVLAALLLLVVSAAGAELTVEEFVDATIARLELAETTWRQEGRSPTRAEEDDLFEVYGTTAESYYQFAGARHRDIEGYLAENPALRDAIEALSDSIRQLIEQGEVE